MSRTGKPAHPIHKSANVATASPRLKRIVVPSDPKSGGAHGKYDLARIYNVWSRLGAGAALPCGPSGARKPQAPVPRGSAGVLVLPTIGRRRRSGRGTAACFE